MANGVKHLLEFGCYRVDPDHRLLLRGPNPVSLSPKAFDLLLVLLERRGEVVSKDVLMTLLWPDTFVEESNLGQHVFQLRKALGDRPQDHVYIVTVPGRGYRFAEEVRPVAPETGNVAQREEQEERGEDCQEEEIVVASRSLATVKLKQDKALDLRVWIAVGAMVAAILVAAGLYTRSQRKPKLTERDTIVLADFDNRTGDPVFDVALRQALAAQLEQSPFLNLLSDQHIAETLSLMTQPKDSRLNPELAHEVCQRTASSAVLNGTIVQIGARYLLTLKAVSCSTGESLAITEAEARDKNRVLDALGMIATEIRGRLGESLASVQKYNVPPERVTTSSLEALQSYSLAMKNRNGNSTLPIELLKRAIQQDPSFAMAYAQLGVIYINIGQNEQGAATIRNAYELRDRVSDREKFYIASHYDHFVNGDLEAARKDYELWREIYPRDKDPYAGLAAVYYLTGDFDKLALAVQETDRLATRPAPNPGEPSMGAIWSLTFLNHIDEAKALALKGQAIDNDPLFGLSLYSFAFLQGDTAARTHQLESLIDNPTWGDDVLDEEAGTLAFFGQFRQSRDLVARAIEAAIKRDKKEPAAAYSVQAALAEALVGNSTQAKQYVKQALALADTKDIRAISALALSMAGDSAPALRLADDLVKRYPKNTIIQSNYLPTVQAATALWGSSRKPDSQRAIQLLSQTVRYESGVTALDNGICFYPVFVRGQAYLANKQGTTAAAEFQKIVDHPGLVVNEPIGALAHLGLGRAYVLSQNSPKAKTEYQSFLSLWKDADSDIPILKQAKAEYAKLQ
jgi:eukaryotic-like serine/threonine-protein kinase